MKENERKWKENERKWKEHKRKMKENERKMKENERKMKENERKMKGIWKENERLWKENMKGKNRTAGKHQKNKWRPKERQGQKYGDMKLQAVSSHRQTNLDQHLMYMIGITATLKWHWLTDIDLTLTWHWQWFVVDSDIVIDIVNSHVTMSHWQFNLPETNQRFTVYRTVPRHFFQPKFIPSEASQDWLQVKQPSFRQCNICAPQHHLNIANFNFQSPTSVHTASNT